MLDQHSQDRLKKRVKTFLALSPENRHMSHLVKVLELDPATSFRFARLKNQDFSNMDLKGWNFEGADLRGSIFTNVQNFEKANLKNAKVNMRDLEQALNLSPEDRETITEQTTAVLPFDLESTWFDQYKSRQEQLSQTYPDVGLFDEVSEATLESFSLNPAEKFKVLEALPNLSQFQKDELVKVFKEERAKFRELAQLHPEDIVKLTIRSSADARFANGLLDVLFDEDDEKLKPLKKNVSKAFGNKKLSEYRALVEQLDYMTSGQEKDELEKLADETRNTVDYNMEKYANQRLWNDEIFLYSQQLFDNLHASQDKNIQDLAASLGDNFQTAFGKYIFLNDPVSKAVEWMKIYQQHSPTYDLRLADLLEAVCKFVEIYRLSFTEKEALKDFLKALEADFNEPELIAWNYYALATNYGKTESYDHALDMIKQVKRMILAHEDNELLRDTSLQVDQNLCELYLVCQQKDDARELCETLLKTDMKSLQTYLIKFIRALAKDDFAEFPEIQKDLARIDLDPKFDWNFRELKYVSNRYDEDRRHEIRDLIKHFETKRSAKSNAKLR